MTEIASLVVRIGADTAGMAAGLNQTEGRLKQLDAVAGKMQKAGAGLGVFFAPMGAALGFATKAAIDFESEFANVVKTVDATDAEIAELRQGIRDLAVSDSPVAGLENALLNITQVAAAAGQLGIATEDILGFSEIMTALGVATDYTAEEAAIMAARFANITGMDASMYANFADALVTLGNNVAATESEIGGFALRLSTLSGYGWETDAILGYSAAMAGLGISAELGGTNLNKSVADMTKALALGGDQLQSYARIAGMTAEEFKALADTSSTDAFTAFLKGFGELDAEQQILQLEAMGITSVEQMTILQRLAGGYGTLTDALGLAAEGWQGNGAAMAEASAKANTTQGDINRLTNNINEMAISAGEALLPALADISEKLIPIVAGIADWANKNPKLVQGIAAVTLGGLALSGMLLLGGTVITGFTGIAELAGIKSGAWASSLGRVAFRLGAVAGLLATTNLEEFRLGAIDLTTALGQNDREGVAGALARMTAALPPGWIYENIVQPMLGLPSLDEVFQTWYEVDELFHETLGNIGRLITEWAEGDFANRLEIAANDISLFFEGVILGIDSLVSNAALGLNLLAQKVTTIWDPHNLLPDVDLDGQLFDHVQHLDDRLAGIDLAGRLRAAIPTDDIRTILRDAGILIEDGVNDLFNPALMSHITSANSAGLKLAVMEGLQNALDVGDMDAVVLLNSFAIQLGVPVSEVAALTAEAIQPAVSTPIPLAADIEIVPNTNSQQLVDAARDVWARSPQNVHVSVGYEIEPLVEPSLIERFASIAADVVNDAEVNTRALFMVRGLINNAPQLIEEMRQSLSALPISATVQALIRVNPVLSGIQNIGNMVMQAAGNFFHGSHADGLPYVPFDGYVAQLHRGERVLTAAENRNYDNGGDNAGGVVFQPGAVVIYAGAGANGVQIADDFERRIGQTYRARGIR